MWAVAADVADAAWIFAYATWAFENPDKFRELQKSGALPYDMWDSVMAAIKKRQEEMFRAMLERLT